MTTITLPEQIAVQLQRRATDERLSVEALAIAYITHGLTRPAPSSVSASTTELTNDPELLALVARITALPPNPASIIPAKGDLAEVLRTLEAVDDPAYDLAVEIAALDAAELELRALDRANDIAEGRG